MACEIQLTDISQIPHLTSALMEISGKSAAVCFQETGYQSKIEHNISGTIKSKMILKWEKLTKEDINSFYDLHEATEWGASAIAFVIIHNFTEYEVIKRSRKGTGFDYYLGNHKSEFYQETAKLEISGILHVTETNSIKSRINEKVKQAERFENELTLFVVVTGFSTKESGVYYVPRKRKNA